MNPTSTTYVSFLVGTAQLALSFKSSTFLTIFLLGPKDMNASENWYKIPIGYE